MNDGTLYKGGWAGQGLIVNPNWDVVAVYTGYFKDDSYSEEPLLPHIIKALKETYGKRNVQIQQILGSKEATTLPKRTTSTMTTTHDNDNNDDDDDNDHDDYEDDDNGARYDSQHGICYDTPARPLL